MCLQRHASIDLFMRSVSYLFLRKAGFFGHMLQMSEVQGG